MSIRLLQALFVFGLLAALLTWVLERSGTTFSPVDRRDIWTLHVAMTGMLLGLAMLIRPGRWRAAGFAAVFGVGALYANGAHTITSFNLIASLGEEAFDRALEAVPWNRLAFFAGPALRASEP